jgi:hypothetical protein
MTLEEAINSFLDDTARAMAKIDQLQASLDEAQMQLDRQRRFIDRTRERWELRKMAALEIQKQSQK